MMEQILNVIFSEYGAFTGFLVLTNGILLGTIRVLWKRNESLSNKLIDTVENNTRVITQLVDKLNES